MENVSEDEINRLLGMVVDVENLFMSVHKEEDTDTKQVYFYLFKVNAYESHFTLTKLKTHSRVHAHIVILTRNLMPKCTTVSLKHERWEQPK